MTGEVWRGVRGDLRRILLAVPGVPDIAWEGRDFEPVAGVAFLRERIDKGGSVARPCRIIEERGIYAIDLNRPRKASFADGEDLADAIVAAFHPSRQIVSGSGDYQFGMVTSAHARPAIMFDDWSQFPIRVEFFFRRAF